MSVPDKRQVPDFIVAGASRSGTTTLYSYLSQQEDIFMSPVKEVRFFDKDENYKKGESWYRKHFAGWDDEEAVGEASPPYFYHNAYSSELPARRIYEYDPQMKLIFTLRNPVERAYSQYCKNVSQGRETKKFSEAINLELQGRRNPNNTNLCWLEWNKYVKHLDKFADLFGRDNMNILIFENWVNEPMSAIKEIFDFLSIERGPNEVERKMHKNKGSFPRSVVINRIVNFFTRGKMPYRKVYDNVFAKALYALEKKLNRRPKPSISAKAKELLRENLADYNQALEKRYEVDISKWKESPSE